MPTTLRPVDRLTVDVVLDNLSDSYSSKPAHVAPEFANVVAAGTPMLSGPTLCCAQLGLALVLTATAGERRHTLLRRRPGGRDHPQELPCARRLPWPTWARSPSRTATGITWGRCSTRSTTLRR